MKDKIFIRHCTLNSGHMRISYSNEVSKDIYFVLKGIVDKAKIEETELIDNTYIRIYEKENRYICSLLLKTENRFVPIMHTAGTKKSESRFSLWEAMQEVIKTEINQYSKYIDKVPVDVPYIVDIIHFTASFHTNILKWTGDFARCLGWMMLYPEEIRK